MIAAEPPEKRIAVETDEKYDMPIFGSYKYDIRNKKFDLEGDADNTVVLKRSDETVYRQSPDSALILRQQKAYSRNTGIPRDKKKLLMVPYTGNPELNKTTTTPKPKSIGPQKNIISKATRR